MKPIKNHVQMSEYYYLKTKSELASMTANVSMCLKGIYTKRISNLSNLIARSISVNKCSFCSDMPSLGLLKLYPVRSITVNSFYIMTIMANWIIKRENFLHIVCHISLCGRIILIFPTKKWLEPEQ